MQQKNLYKILGGIFDSHNIDTKLLELSKLIEKKDFWKNKKKVKKEVKKKKI